MRLTVDFSRTTGTAPQLSYCNQQIVPKVPSSPGRALPVWPRRDGSSRCLPSSKRTSKVLYYRQTSITAKISPTIFTNDVQVRRSIASSELERWPTMASIFSCTAAHIWKASSRRSRCEGPSSQCHFSPKSDGIQSQVAARS